MINKTVSKYLVAKTTIEVYFPMLPRSEITCMYCTFCQDDRSCYGRKKCNHPDNFNTILFSPESGIDGNCPMEFMED